MRILQKERAVRNWPKLYRKGEDILLHKQSAKKYRDDQLNFLENYSRRYLVSDEFYDCAKASINNRYIYDLYFPMVNKQILRKDIPEGYFDEDLRVTNSLSRLYITALWYCTYIIILRIFIITLIWFIIILSMILKEMRELI